MKLNPLCIGSLTASIPIVQGGMGVGISLSNLAGAVAKEGGVGVISAAHPGFLEPDFSANPLHANLRALKAHIIRAKEIANGGIIGVNIMRATAHYEDYVNCCISAGADLIISGAGLPVELPELIGDSPTMYAPIVSSQKAAKVLMQRWDKRGLRMPDLVVIEGPKAGGHLGFSAEELIAGNDSGYPDYDEEVKKIVAYVKSFEKKYNRPFPVVFAGGVFDRADIDHYLALGCDGVQIATRFVATEECDAAPAYKQAYINAKKEDITIVKSPVGMPGRAIENTFMRKRKTERENVQKCFRCMDKCDPRTTPYCITGALTRAAQGDVENSLVFCGANAYRIDKMTTVKELMKELSE